MRGKNRNPIEKSRKKLPQFTTMNVMDGQAGLVNYTSLILYSLTIDNILNIIVLIILAGVSINMLVGDNGIITQAQQSKIENEKAEIIEKIQLEIADKQAENLGTIYEEEFYEILGKYGIVSDDETTLTTTEGNYKIAIADIYSGEVEPVLVTTPIESWEYTISETNVILTKYIGEDKEILVPDTFTINGLTYNTVLENYTNETASGPLANNTTITKVKFGDNVTVKDNSGYALFYRSSNLERVYNYPKGITSMTSMFGGTKVKKIADIPEGVTSIASILYNVKTIKSFPKISSTVTSMNTAFYGCSSISGDLYVYSDNISNATDAFYGIGNYYTIYVDENTTSYETLSNALTAYGSINEKKEQAEITRIIAWGDSLTAGAGGNGTSYRNVLDSLIKEIHFISNGGVGGESVQSIAARQGGNPIYVNEFVIPADNIATEISINDQNDNTIVLARQGTSALNPVSINGIEGNISYDTNDAKYYFTRTTTGNEVIVENNTQIITSGMKNNRDDLMIIWAGTNNKPDSSSIQNVINYINRMIEYSNNDRYIVIGLTAKAYIPEVEEVNNILKETYSSHFLDIRTYLLENGLKDAEISPTAQDTIDISNGEIPTSLRSDDVHLNEKGYTIVAEQVYNKLIELGYIEE